ncbi:MAG: glycoside hydrolase family 18 protein [Burkholderiales bacterium]|nr:glycoside hydrolase family 18 protein [Burkholderiales bacterium]
MRTAASIAAAVLLGGCAHYEVIGYYAGWKDPIPVAAREITVLNYAFVDICWDGQHGHPVEGGLKPCPGANGALALDDPVKEASTFARLVSLKRDNPRLRLMVSVGGWTRSNRFSDMANDAATRAAFVDSSVAFLRRYAFDGIDIDWEYPNEIGVPCPATHTCQRPEDKRNFITLGAELRDALDAAGRADGKRYLVTIAAGADEKFLRDPDGGRWLAKLARSLDWINLMTYDYHGSWERITGLNAPLQRDPRDLVNASAEASVARVLASGIPASKVTLGMPFYGKGWAGCAPGPAGDGLFQPCEGLASGSSQESFDFAYLTARGYLVRDSDSRYTSAGLGFARHWNAPARSPYLYNPATRVFITYDDEISIREKSRFVKERGLRGAMFWELDADREGILRRVIAEELAK